MTTLIHSDEDSNNFIFLLVSCKTHICLSQDPNDCLVWCQEWKIEQYYLDMNGNKVNFKECPEFFEFYKKERQCIRYLEDSEVKIERIEVKVKENNDVVSILGWEVVQCK